MKKKKTQKYAYINEAVKTVKSLPGTKLAGLHFPSPKVEFLESGFISLRTIVLKV